MESALSSDAVLDRVIEAMENPDEFDRQMQENDRMLVSCFCFFLFFVLFFFCDFMFWFFI